ncbi:glycosyltransferase [Microbacterium memoriense]|uniref:Glycosyltransferase n=1 Tax=Microbacterium memoriense TaxID=2978350 RepID=A0ABT2PDF5_9MICO|nr:glycosyltransferase [Microbacterium memoriense]MCT9002630.1 glycosyltransferase [Microbacterium memoriense]
MSRRSVATPLIWLAGVGWDETAGTDRRIVTALGRSRDVVWVDPPNRRTSWRRWLTQRAPEPHEGVDRIAVPATIGVTRWPFRLVSAWLRTAATRRAMSRVPQAVIVMANPLASLPRNARQARVLYVTDDWVAGAPLMGVSTRLVERTLRRNAQRADVVVVVSPALLDLVPARIGSRPRIELILPNGAPPVTEGPLAARQPIAGLVGQINERIDLGILEAIVAAGIPLRIVGPETMRDPSQRERLAALRAHPLVEWRGPVPVGEVPSHLREIAVGLTPYALSSFNRASSPLKTLEYLASGVPVVSSDLPAATWLGSADVAIAADAAAFVRAAQRFIEERADDVAERRRRDFARRHGWDMRAAELLAVLDRAGGAPR